MSRSSGNVSLTRRKGLNELCLSYRDGLKCDCELFSGRLSLGCPIHASEVDERFKLSGTMSHLSIGTNDLPRAKTFYDAVLETLQIGVVVEHPGAVAYGWTSPEFWLQLPHGTAAVGNGSHFGFLATSRAQVDAFYAKALALGGQGMARRASGRCIGRSSTAPLCATWMATRSRPCSGMRRRGDFAGTCLSNAMLAQWTRAQSAPE